MNQFDAVSQLLGKYRYGPLDNTQLTRAILSAVKRAEDEQVLSCGHNVSYEEEGNCVICLTKALGESPI